MKDIQFVTHFMQELHREKMDNVKKYKTKEEAFEAGYAMCLVELGKHANMLHNENNPLCK